MKSESTTELSIDNIRLKELKTIVERNKPFYADFVSYIQSVGYPSIQHFVNEPIPEKGKKIIEFYLRTPRKADLLDGVGNAYSKKIAPWYFLGWLFRDAPVQRLGPMVSSLEGKDTMERMAVLLNKVRIYAGKLFSTADQWSWTAISEVMLARLEGSRRALMGNVFEVAVREILNEIINEKKIKISVYDKQVKISGETYDVQIIGKKKSILLPVKTRETMGGGHAMLFTRDIHKSIAVAHKAGYVCIPIIIAESWTGDLKSLDCKEFIYINLNPNQLLTIKPILKKELEKCVNTFLTIV